jgi:hypothetical protein
VEKQGKANTDCTNKNYYKLGDLPLSWKKGTYGKGLLVKEDKL